MSRVLPILFNTDMVRAILDGRKTVTRRCVKPQSKNAYGFYVTFRKSDNAFMGVYDYDENGRQFDNSQTPPCQPGDILYVRETWRKHSFGFDMFIYKANYTEISKKVKWRPSIHMPKEAARIWLKVTDMRVEKLQDITNEQIINEGISKDTIVHYLSQFPEREAWERAAHLIPFTELWNDTIKKQDIGLYDWDANPWVWVIEFERCEKPEEN